MILSALLKCQLKRSVRGTVVFFFPNLPTPSRVQTITALSCRCASPLLLPSFGPLMSAKMFLNPSATSHRGKQDT